MLIVKTFNYALITYYFPVREMTSIIQYANYRHQPLKGHYKSRYTFPDQYWIVYDNL